MGSNVRIVSGEPVKVTDTTSFLDRAIEGSDVHRVTATDSRGNSAEGMGRSQEKAENNAIFNLNSKRD